MRKDRRVKSERDFQQVFDHGKSMANRQFVVYTLSKSDQDHFRVGISVGKKIGHAVKRNRVKRLIRAAIQELSSNIKTGIDFIIIARQPVQDMAYHEILSSLKHVLNLSQVLLKSKSE